MDRSFFRFVTIHAFDRRTERQTDGRTDTFLIASPCWRSIQRGKITNTTNRSVEVFCCFRNETQLLSVYRLVS